MKKQLQKGYDPFLSGKHCSACNQRDKKQPKSSIKNQSGMIEDTPLHFRTNKKQTGSS
jgi:hypothetical protein